MNSTAYAEDPLFPVEIFAGFDIHCRAVEQLSTSAIHFMLSELENLRALAMLDAGRRVWMVGDLLRAIADSLEARFNPVTVTGEVTAFSQAASGHCYFSLKDELGQIRCAMFRRAATLLGFIPTNGQRVELRGRLGVYGQRGELQLIVESMQQAGDGDLFKRFFVLKAKLESEGLFESSRKRAIPPLPRAVGVVTSLGAAALHDVVHALERRAPHVPLVIYPASVQGTQSAEELRQALLTAYRRNEVDVLLLVRGGGSVEDLWTFNDEMLARTIVESPMPLVCGVGHETDFTIADFCADLRAPTPTAAAELCAQPVDVLFSVLESIFSQLQRQTHRQIDSHAQQLDRAVVNLGRPSHLITRQQAQLDALAQYLKRAGQSRLQVASGGLDASSENLPRQIFDALQCARLRAGDAQFRLDLLDPKLVLQRGYAWLTDMQGKAVTSAKSVCMGQPLRAILADGEVDLTVSAPRLI